MTRNEIKTIIKEEENKRLVRCKQCGSPLILVKSKVNTVKCKWIKGCGIVYNIWEKTIFANTKIKKTIILRTIELWLKKLATN